MYEPITTPDQFDKRVRPGSASPAHEDIHLEFKELRSERDGVAQDPMRLVLTFERVPVDAVLTLEIDDGEDLTVVYRTCRIETSTGTARTLLRLSSPLRRGTHETRGQARPVSW